MERNAGKFIPTMTDLGWLLDAWKTLDKELTESIRQAEDSTITAREAKSSELSVDIGETSEEFESAQEFFALEEDSLVGIEVSPAHAPNATQISPAETDKRLSTSDNLPMEDNLDLDEMSEADITLETMEQEDLELEAMEDDLELEVPENVESELEI